MGPGEGIVRAQEWVGGGESAPFPQSPVGEREGGGRQRPLLSLCSEHTRHTDTDRRIDRQTHRHTHTVLLFCRLIHFGQVKVKKVCAVCFAPW